MVALEADWPDVKSLDRYVRHGPSRHVSPDANLRVFDHFPRWMWRNDEVRDFVNWLRQHNAWGDNSQTLRWWLSRKRSLLS